MYYYHISVSTPFGFAEISHRNKLHPLDPEMLKKRREEIANKIALKTGKVIPLEAVNFIAFNEIPKDIAQRMYPEDFIITQS